MAKMGRPIVLDWPKIEALRNAGWLYKDIAREADCHIQTVYKHFKRLKDDGKTVPSTDQTA